MSYPIRIFYEKVGRAKYISHLDMERCMQRALKRCKLPVWYTEGFNKRMYLSFVVPLSLGFESKYEILDLKLDEELPLSEVKERINAVLPEGMTICRVAEPIHKVAEITNVSYEVTLHPLPDQTPQMLLDTFEAFLTQDQILVEKKSKKGVISEVDLVPLMQLDPVKLTESGIVYTGRYACGQQGNMNPTQLVAAFAAACGAETQQLAPAVLRTGVYAGEELFV